MQAGSRTLLAALLVATLVALAAPATAKLSDATDFTTSALVRGAIGDIPLTTPVEPAGRLNVVEYVRLTHAQGSASSASFTLPAGATVDGAECTCESAVTLREEPQGGRVVTVPANESMGSPVVALRFHVESAKAFTVALAAPTVGTGTTWNLYVPDGTSASSTLGAATTLPSTADHPGLTIHNWVVDTASAASANAGFSFYPAAASTTGTTVTPTSGSSMPWLWLVGGVLLGAIVWAFLVSKGMVQSRSRKQVVAVAAHVEAAKTEPVPVLEAKKRFLMGAMKDIEIAKQNNELDNATYDAVKADFKKQTVTVMRAIETAPKDP